MNDLERWIHLQGPPPPHIRALFDAARAMRDLPQATPEPRPAPPPELWDDLDRRVFAAIAADQRRDARRRAAKKTVKTAVGLGLLAAGVAFALALGDAARRAAPSLSTAAMKSSPAALVPVLGATVSAPPSVSAKATVPPARSSGLPR